MKEKKPYTNNFEIKLGYYTDSFGDIVEITDVGPLPHSKDTEVSFQFIVNESGQTTDNRNPANFSAILDYTDFKYLKGYNTKLWKTLNK